MPRHTWTDFQALLITCFGPVPDKGTGMPYRYPEIYRNMHHTRYFSYVVDWHAYPHEFMGHYCRRFREMMSPHIPQDLDCLEMQTLHEIPPQEAEVDADAEDDPDEILFDDGGIQKMVCPRRIVPLNPPEPDLATVVANLQQQLLEQQRETNRLQEQIARMNQRPQVNEVLPRAHQVPPVVPPVPEVQPEVQPEAPRNAEIPMAPAGVQMNLPLVREDLLYERFRRMKAPEFEGPMDPTAADNWLIDD
ncbi:hypothetical protein TIFTF001_041252 [Ficus carica]|uniref:Uncharacterized protein n=1 Tax=Ficus carica TaxID=3494 RepID=A0AA87Z534_FICCA|nr:hypothetical protein TIFTF001_041252 [Ficus carica]